MAKKNIEYEQRIGELTVDLQRTRADFENFRKNVDADKTRLAIVVKNATIVKLLPMVDDIERAMKHIPVELVNNEWAKGVMSLKTKLEKQLESLGVKRIMAEAGTEFNPEIHEAVLVDDVDGEHEVVAEELVSGYTLDGEVIRPASVKVTRKD